MFKLQARTFLHVSLLGVAVAIAGCSNTGKNKVSFVPSQEVGTGENKSLLKRIVDSNEVQNTGNAGQNVAALPVTSDQTKFSSKAYGVKGSPRVTKSKRVKKGGGRYQVGKPYTIRGRRYVPREDPNYKAVGLASWYGPNFHGRLTANGEVYDQYALSAAHPTMPLPSYAKVTNLENGASVTVRVNDRGPFAHNRVIDLSSRAAQLLGYTKKGLAKVKVEYVGKARMDGLDEEQLVATYNPGRLDPRSIPPNPGGQVLLAQAEEPRRANPARVALSAIANDGFKAPVPASRPYNATAGYPIELSRALAPRPSSLVNGYAAETANEAVEVLNGMVSSDESTGMAGLKSVQTEQLPLEVARELAPALLQFGPVSELEGSTPEFAVLVVTHDLADAHKVQKYLKDHSVTLEETQPDQ